jgi:hypothetical protein
MGTILLRTSERAPLFLSCSRSFFGMSNRHWNKQMYAGRHTKLRTDPNPVRSAGVSSTELLLLSHWIRVGVDSFQDRDWSAQYSTNISLSSVLLPVLPCWFVDIG